MEEVAKKSGRKFSRRYFAFRLLAICIGLSPLIGMELLLSGLDWKPPGGVKDPYVGFTELRTLFAKSSDDAEFAIAGDRYPLFRPESFSVEKGENEFRIFCIGGSTVQGRPFAIETAFSTWLELGLNVADPSVDWNAINCGGVSYASYRLAPIVEEVLQYEPDLIVLYTGQNEFLEDRTYDAVKSTSPWIRRAHDRLSSFKTYSFLRSLIVSKASNEPSDASKLPSDVEARLDFRGGLELYHRDDDWHENVVEHYGHNVRRMISAAKQAGVPLIVCNPVCNLRDCAPFKSQPDEKLTKNQRENFEAAWEKLQDESQLNLDLKIRQLEELVSISPRHAMVRFHLGQAYLQQGEIGKAKIHLEEAREQDVCPLRMTEALYDELEEACRENKLPLLDVKAKFERWASDGIPGAESLVDHVHPSIRGHQVIAELLMEEMIAQRMLAWGEGFEAERDAVFRDHLASLPFMYFESGKDRLAGLKRWAEGKVTREVGEPLK